MEITGWVYLEDDSCTGRPWPIEGRKSTGPYAAG